MDGTVELEEDLAVSIDPEVSPHWPNKGNNQAKPTVNVTLNSEDEDNDDDDDSDDIDAELNKLEQSV